MSPLRKEPTDLASVSEKEAPRRHEVALHAVADALEAAIAANKRWYVRWGCQDCGEYHRRDLAAFGGEVRRDRRLAQGARPDITLCDRSGNPRAVIEIVVTHAPEEAARQVYRDLSMPLVLVYPADSKTDVYSEGLEKMHEYASRKHTRVFVVPPQACERSWTPPLEEAPLACGTCAAKTINVACKTREYTCWKCRYEGVKVLDVYALLGGELVGVAPGASDFLAGRVLADQYKVRAERRYVQAVNSTYLATTCRCGAVQGDMFLYGFAGFDDDVEEIFETFDETLGRSRMDFEADEPREAFQPGLFDAIDEGDEDDAYSFDSWIVCERGHAEYQETLAPGPTQFFDSRYVSALGLCGDRAGLFEKDFAHSR